MKGPCQEGGRIQAESLVCRSRRRSVEVWMLLDGCGSGKLARPPARSYKETLKVECDTFTGRAPQRRAVSNSNESEQWLSLSQAAFRIESPFAFIHFNGSQRGFFQRSPSLDFLIKWPPRASVWLPSLLIAAVFYVQQIHYNYFNHPALVNSNCLLEINKITVPFSLRSQINNITEEWKICRHLRSIKHSTNQRVGYSSCV